jgi:hypothetical protein
MAVQFVKRRKIFIALEQTSANYHLRPVAALGERQLSGKQFSETNFSK